MTSCGYFTGPTMPAGCKVLIDRHANFKSILADARDILDKVSINPELDTETAVAIEMWLQAYEEEVMEE